MVWLYFTLGVFALYVVVVVVSNRRDLKDFDERQQSEAVRYRLRALLRTESSPAHAIPDPREDNKPCV